MNANVLSNNPAVFIILDTNSFEVIKEMVLIAS